MTPRRVQAVLLLSVLAVSVLLTWRPTPLGAEERPRWTIEQLLDLNARPFAIAHHGFGANLGEDPTRPIENTLAAVRRGFRAGASVVEIDVQLTKDGHVVLYHDDFLPDFTCLHTLTLEALRARVPSISTLRAVLDLAREVNARSRTLGGLMIVELKAPSPLCDPDDTQEQAIVDAVVKVIRAARMINQVFVNSFSPALLLLMKEVAPEIPRDLGIAGLQFLTADEVTAVLKLPVKLIDKKIAVGLQWAEIGQLFRLPGYTSLNDVVATVAALEARIVEADLDFLDVAGLPAVAALQELGLKVLGETATTPDEWFFLQSLGVDGIYVDDVLFGVAHEAPLPQRTAHPFDRR